MTKLSAVAPAATNTPARCADDSRHDGGHELLELVRAARGGDGRAWDRLHARFNPMLRRIAYTYRLSPSDVDDAVQATWVHLLNHIDRLRDPSAVGGWLVTTTRRECLRILQRPLREHVTDDPRLGDSIDVCADPARDLLEAERRAVLTRALDTLPDRQRELMLLLLTEPTIDYHTVSTTLGMPRGSIGPIRQRSIARLQCHEELCSVT